MIFMLATPAIVEYGSTFREFLGGIVVAPDGSVWAAECNGAVRLSRDGSVVEMRRPDDGNQDCEPYNAGEIGVGPDGAVWTNAFDRLFRFSDDSVRGVDYLKAGGWSTSIHAFAADATGVYFSRGESQGFTHIDASGAETFVPIPASIISIASGNGTLWLQGLAGADEESQTPQGFFVRSGEQMRTGIGREFLQTRDYLASAVAPDGTLVIAARQKPETFNPIEIARLAPDGSVRPITRIAAGGAVTSIGAMAVANDGGIWFTEPFYNRVARLDPNGSLHVFRDGIPNNAEPYGVSLDRDGSLWFTDDGRNTIEHATLDGHVRVYGNGLRPDNAPGGPVATDDGAVWFRETNGWHERIARIAPGGALSEFPDPAGVSGSAVVEPYGDGVALVGTPIVPGGGAPPAIYAIARDGSTHAIDTRGCFIAAVNFACLPQLRKRGTLHYAGFPQSVTVGPDGNLWFTDVFGSAIGRISRDGTLRLFTRGLTRYHSGPQYITRGPDGALWFTELRDRIGRITTDGRITEFDHLLPARSYVGGIVAGPDGNLWFTLYHGNELVRMTPQGVVTRFHEGIYPSRGNDGVAADSVPSVDSQGRIWFNESEGGRIARATLPSP